MASEEDKGITEDSRHQVKMKTTCAGQLKRKQKDNNGRRERVRERESILGPQSTVPSFTRVVTVDWPPS